MLVLCLSARLVVLPGIEIPGRWLLLLIGFVIGWVLVLVR